MKRATISSSRQKLLRRHFFSVFSAVLLVLIITHPVPVYSLLKNTVRDIRSCALNMVNIKDQIVSISPADFYPVF